MDTKIADLLEDASSLASVFRPDKIIGFEHLLKPHKEKEKKEAAADEFMGDVDEAFGLSGSLVREEPSSMLQ